MDEIIDNPDVNEQKVYILEAKPPCIDQEHKPPMHIVIPFGKMLRHTCPSCGKVTVVKPINFTY